MFIKDLPPEAIVVGLMMRSCIDSARIGIITSIDEDHTIHIAFSYPGSEHITHETQKHHSISCEVLEGDVNGEE